MRGIGKYRDSFILLGILLVAFSLRIYQLGTESLYLDEAFSVRTSSNSFGQLLKASLADINPPLYYLLLHYWMLLFGSSEFWVRLPSVLFGTCSVAVLYKLGSILFNKVTGLISASILALSAWQIYSSQTARTYSLMVLLTLLSFYFFLRLFEGKDYRVLAGYILSTTALMYSHYYGLLFVLAQTLFLFSFYALQRNREQAPGLSTWALAGGALVILYIPGVVYFAYAWAQRSLQGWISKPDVLTLYDSVVAWAGVPGLRYSNPPQPLTFAGVPGLSSVNLFHPLILLLPFVFFATVSVAALAASREERAKLYLLSLWLVLPIFLPSLLSQILTPFYVLRYPVAALPAFYLLVAEGIRRTSSFAVHSTWRGRARLASLVVLGVLLAVIALSSLDVLNLYYTTTKKEQWRTAASKVEAQAEPGDLLVISQSFTQSPYDYYARRDGEALPKEVPLNPAQANEVGAVVGDSDRVWLVLSFVSDDEEKQFKAELEKAGFEETNHWVYSSSGYWPHNRIDLTLFER